MSFPFSRGIRLACVALAFLAACPGPCARAEDWPRWRGPRLDGISPETGLLKEWPKEGPRQLWKAPLSGGFSSVAVADGLVFTQTKEKDQEVVVCLDAASGKDVWRYRYDCDYAAHKTFTGGGMPASRTGPRATPAVDAGRVYALGATGILLCLEAKTGKKVWQQDLLKIAGSDCPRHGYCGSPLVVGDRLYVEPGGPKGKSVAALNKKDGSVVWQALDDPIGQSSPIWAEVGGAGQVIFFTGALAVGVAPADGALGVLERPPGRLALDIVGPARDTVLEDDPGHALCIQPGGDFLAFQLPVEVPVAAAGADEDRGPSVLVLRRPIDGEGRVADIGQ
jgi:hypothetical protein